MREEKNLVNIYNDNILVEFPPKNEKIRNEFLNQSMKNRMIYENATLKYKDPEKTKLYIRTKIRKLGYNILHNELDHWEIKFGRGPMFRQVESKSFVLSLKAIKSNHLSKIIGYITIGIGVFIFIISLLSGILESIIGAISLIVLIFVGNWIKAPLTIWIKGEGIAHRIKGKEILSDQYYQFSAECGFKELGKEEILRKDFDIIFKEIIEFLGKAK